MIDAPAAPPIPGLRTRFSKAAIWTVTETYGSAALNFAFVIVLARLLDSRDFGLAAAATVTTLFFLTLTDTAAISAVVQRSTATQAELSAVFWCSTTFMSAVYLALFLLAPFIASVTRAPELAAILRVAGLQLPLMGVLTVPLALLRTRLRARPAAFAQLAAVITSGAFAIYLAFNGYGYWALVVQGIIALLVRTVWIWYASGWRPARAFRTSDLRPFIAYTGGMAGFTTVNYWSRSIDIMLIGGAFGAAAAGYYNLAYRVIGMPIQLVSGALRPILHPALVAMNGDTDRMHAAYLRLMRLTALISLPFAALLFSAADLIVAALWGSEWQPVTAILRALALLAAVQPLNALSAPIYMATAATSLMFRQSMLQAAILVSAMLVGLQFGLAGVAWGYSLAYTLLVMPIATGIAIRRQLHQPIRTVWPAIAPGLVIALAILAIAWLA